MRRGVPVRFLLVAIAALAAWCGLGACSRSERPEGGGAAPDGVRIAALSPAVAVTLRAIGAGDLVVARHGYDTFTDPAVPVAGDQGGIDYESLRRVRPTVVILEWGSRPLPPRLTELAGLHGWRVESVPMLTADDVRSTTLRVAGLTGSPAAEAEASRLVEAFDAALAPDRGVAARMGRCLVLFSVSPPAAAGPGSVHHEIIERMGIEPAIRSGSPFIELDPEGLRRLAPDSIVLLLPGASEEQAKAAAEAVRGFGLRSGTERRILVVTDPLCQTPTIHLADMAEAIRAGSEGWVPGRRHE